MSRGEELDAVGAKRERLSKGDGKSRSTASLAFSQKPQTVLTCNELRMLGTAHGAGGGKEANITGAHSVAPNRCSRDVYSVAPGDGGRLLAFAPGLGTHLTTLAELILLRQYWTTSHISHLHQTTSSNVLTFLGSSCVPCA